MRKFLLAGAAALAALSATPALAQTNANFTGLRAEVQAGVRDTNITNEKLTYGAVVGADIPLGDRLTLGADFDATNPFKENGRSFGAGGRLGYAFSPSALGFVRAGYTNLDLGRHYDGLTLGGGLQFSLAPNTYLNTEYRYSNYEQGVHGHAGLLGLGIRFK
jgi:outer membrane immunogenic protein